MVSTKCEEAQRISIPEDVQKNVSKSGKRELRNA
jgi:hypothetical protein